MVVEWGKWYRSKEKKGGNNPFASYLLNKKWTLEEEFNNHMLRFQQVKCSEFYFTSVNFILTFQAGLTMIEVGFKEEPAELGSEPLQMEHFHLPLGMWFVGILISLFCFIAEIIKNWIKKWKAKRLSDTEGAEMDLAVLEVDKARVTFQQEVQHNTDVQDIEDTEDTEET